MITTKLGDRIHQQRTGHVSVLYEGIRRPHVPNKDLDEEDIELGYLSQVDQDKVKAFFNQYGRKKFHDAQTARKVQDLIDNPILPPLTAQQKFDKMDDRMKAVVKTVAQLTSTPLQDAINIVKSHMN